MGRAAVSVEESLCKSCGICVEMCPREVLVATEPLRKATVAHLARCTGCGLCAMYCPDWAIDVVRMGGSQ